MRGSNVAGPGAARAQEFLNDRLKSCPEGVVCVADVQGQGKGRGGNVWESPAGSLLFSFTARVSRAELLPFYQYLVSIAMHRSPPATSNVT